MKGRPVTTMEDLAPYRTGPTDNAEPPLTIEALIAQAHVHHQGILDGSGDPLLRKRPERRRGTGIATASAAPGPAARATRNRPTPNSGVGITLTLGGRMSLSTIETAGPPTISHGDTIEHFLTGLKGRQATIRLESGADLTGTVREVTGPLVHASDLADPAGCDAVVVTKNIAAVIVRVRTS